MHGRLWRKANPALSTEKRQQLISKLMDARRALRGERPAEERAAAHRAVDEAKQALGERGPSVERYNALGLTRIETHYYPGARPKC